MGNVLTGPDGFGVWLTGAEYPSAAQSRHALSLGAYPGDTRADGLMHRMLEPVRGLRVVYASGPNGEGTGILAAQSDGTVRWRSPGDDEAGTAVAIAAGETKVLESDSDPSAYVIVYRWPGVTPSGSGSVRLASVQHAAFIGNDVEEAAQVTGVTSYRCLSFRNRGPAEVTNVKVWQSADNPAGLSWGVDAVRSGVMPYQDISVFGEQQAPQVASWESGTSSGAGLVLGDFGPGDDKGVWFRLATAADAEATPKQDWTVYYEYDLGDETYSGVLMGWRRIADAGLVGYLAYLGVDEAPDMSAAWQTFTAFPWESPALVEGLNRIIIRERNAYGLIGQDWTEYQVRVEADGSEGAEPPSAPIDIAVEAAAGGLVRVTAAYLWPQDDADVRADTWAIWAQAGSALDPDTDAATDTEAMSAGSGASVLDAEIGPFTDGVTVYVSVRARRDGDTPVDSENDEVVTTTADATAPDDIDHLACQEGLLTDALSAAVEVWADGEDASIERVPGTMIWRFRIGGVVVAAVDAFGQLHCETLNSLPFDAEQAMSELVEWSGSEIWIGAGSPLQRVATISSAGAR